jgi:hypothetical protein
MPLAATFPNGLKPVIPAPYPPSPDDLAHNKYGMPSRIHVYRDSSGGWVFANRRFDLANQKKTYSPLARFERPDGTQEWKQLAPVRGMVYGMDRLATEPDKLVLLVEGEKCVDIAKDQLNGYVVVTWYGGANKAEDVDLTPLASRRVLLWSDNDDPGREAMDTIAQRLLAERIAASVEMVDLEKAVAAFALGDADDVADVLEGGFTAEAVADFLDNDSNRTVPREGSLGRSQQAVANRAFLNGLQRYGIKVDAAERLTQRPDIEEANKLTADDVTIDRLANRITVEANAGGASIAPPAVFSGSRVIVADLARERRKEIVSHLTTGGEPATAEVRVSELVRIWCGSVLPLVVRVIWHWMWNVKRAMVGLPFAHDVMAIFVGPQGSGKSTAVRRLVTPLADLVDDLNVEVLTDNRRARERAKYLVGLWDEMQGASRGDMEAIKNSITCSYKNYRPMRTNDDASVRRTMSFIGTSNISLAEVIPDSTGMRRFFEVPSVARMDFEAVNNFDYVGLWRAVDPRSEAPILPVLAEIRMVQEESRARDSFDLFVDWTLHREPEDPIQSGFLSAAMNGISASQAMFFYGSFCKNRHLTAIGQNAFFRRAKETIIDMHQSSQDRRRIYSLKPAVIERVRML